MAAILMGAGLLPTLLKMQMGSDLGRTLFPRRRGLSQPWGLEVECPRSLTIQVRGPYSCTHEPTRQKDILAYGAVRIGIGSPHRLRRPGARGAPTPGP